MATTTAQVKPLEAVGSGRGGGPPAGLVPVTFESQGETIVGRLFPPAFGDRPAPAVAILGPETFQKERAPTQYADRLSQLGFAALSFDPATGARAVATRAATRIRSRTCRHRRDACRCRSPRGRSRCGTRR
jgi:fermentation-respiration switch protein FrsA (DUF1100 family)